jgi:hypothetical protein
MTPRIRKLFTFPIDDELAAGLIRIEARDGISKAEQIRRGIRLWLKSKGVSVKAPSRRGGEPRRNG